MLNSRLSSCRSWYEISVCNDLPDLIVASNKCNVKVISELFFSKCKFKGLKIFKILLIIE